MSLLSIFKATIPSINYIFKNGKTATFRRRGDDPAGQYLTGDPDEVAELTKEVKANHPHIYIDPSDHSVEENLADPQVAKEAAMYDRIRAQVIKELGDSNQPYVAVKDFGATEARAMLGGIANSTTMQGTTAENDLQNTNSAVNRLREEASQNALQEQLVILKAQKTAQAIAGAAAGTKGEQKAEDTPPADPAADASKLKINIPSKS